MLSLADVLELPVVRRALPSAVLGPGRATAGAFGILMTGRNLGVLLGPIVLAELSKRPDGWADAILTFSLSSTVAVLLALPLAGLVRRRAGQGTSR